MLTNDEVRDLTGYRRPSAQIRWLRQQGWRFTVNALGRPAIAVAEFNRRMVGNGRGLAQQEPDWNALNAVTGVERNGPQTQAG